MAAVVEDESEWEYEYDRSTTEDLYITLDLTTHIPPTFTRDKRSKPQRSAARASNKSYNNAIGSTDTSMLDSENAEPTHDSDGTPIAERMQIVGLHDKNPIISYNNAVYSCQWATDVGTNIFLAPPATELDPNHVALRSNPSFDVLGTSSARLVAIPATLHPHDPEASAPVANSYPMGNQQSWTTAEGDVIQQNPTQGLRIELPSTASAARVSQAKFLEALSAIKLRKGDRDVVPVTNIKTYRPPEGWQDLKADYIDREKSRLQREKAEAKAKASGQKEPVQHVPESPASEQQEDASVDDDDGAENESNADTNAGTQDKDGDTPEPISSISRKRKAPTRGGPRGGAPSGKRLRQSLGLPEARRDKDKRPRGRPRKARPSEEAMNNTTSTGTEASNVVAGQGQGSIEWQAEQQGTSLGDAVLEQT